MLQGISESDAGISNISQATLDSINVEQARTENKAKLESLGGVQGIGKSLGVDFSRGLSLDQVTSHRKIYGDNAYPESPMDSYLTLLIGALSDTTLLILLAAACVAFGVGIYQEGPEHGWHEGGAIFIAVFLVSNLAAANDYSKQLQFRELENTSAKDELCSVVRNGNVELINPKDLVVGDIIKFQVCVFLFFIH